MKFIKLSEIINNSYNVDMIYKKYSKNEKNISDYTNINKYEKSTEKIYSDNGEEGVLKYIFEKIGTKNKYCIEFGARDGIRGSNTYYFRKHLNWTSLLLECDSKFIDSNSYKQNLYLETVSSKNINNLFKKYNVPKEFDLLSIDIDSDDYYVWKNLIDYKPRIVIIETNPGLPNSIPLVIKEGSAGKNGISDDEFYFGANLRAIYRLAKLKEYEFVTTVRWNAIFIRKDLFNLLDIPYISEKECIENYFKPNKWWLNKLKIEIKNKNREWIIPEKL